MSDVAQRAGVSATTVSLALRHHPSISQATRDRVFEAQRDLGYRVNRFARELVRRGRGFQSRTRLEQLAFCLLGMSFDNEAYAPFLHGIVQESQARHLHLFTQSLEISETGCVTLSAALRDGNVDGVIVSGIVNDGAIESLQQHRLPLVVLGNHDLKTPVARVELDMRQTGERMAEYLLECGHRRIAFMVEHENHAYERTCLEGVQACLSAHQCSPSNLDVISTNSSYSTGAAFVELLLRLDPLPTAIITTDTRVADECVAELRARQIEVPGRMEVVSLAASPNRSRSMRYRALNLGLERCGRLAVKRLAELVESPDGELSTSTLKASEWLDTAPVQLLPRAPTQIRT